MRFPHRSQKSESEGIRAPLLLLDLSSGNSFTDLRGPLHVSDQMNTSIVTHVNHAGHYLFYRRNDGIVKTCYIYHLAWNSALDVMRFGLLQIA